MQRPRDGDGETAEVEICNENEIESPHRAECIFEAAHDIAEPETAEYAQRPRRVGKGKGEQTPILVGGEEGSEAEIEERGEVEKGEDEVQNEEMVDEAGSYGQFLKLRVDDGHGEFDAEDEEIGR